MNVIAGLLYLIIVALWGFLIAIFMGIILMILVVLALMHRVGAYRHTPVQGR